MTRILASLLLLLCRPETVQACAVCFGKSDSRMAQGMNMGIFTLLAFIGGTLATLACFFVYLAVRASRVSPPEAPSETASEQPFANSTPV